VNAAGNGNGCAGVFNHVIVGYNHHSGQRDVGGEACGDGDGVAFLHIVMVQRHRHAFFRFAQPHQRVAREDAAFHEGGFHGIADVGISHGARVSHRVAKDGVAIVENRVVQELAVGEVFCEVTQAGEAQVADGALVFFDDEGLADATGANDIEG